MEMIEMKLRIKQQKKQGVLQKFCIVQLFSACGNTVPPKLCVHVTEGIPSTHAKFRSNRLKIIMLGREK